MGEASKPDCPLPEQLKDSGGCYPFEVFLRMPADCAIPAACFSSPQEIYDKHGHKLDGDWDPQGENGCDHQETKEWKAENLKKERKMAKEAPKHEEPKHEESAQLAIPAVNDQITDAVTQKTKAITEVPQTAAAELSGIIGQDVSGAQVAMAVVAVAGGGAAIKLYNNMSKRKHEQKMAEIESHKSERKSEKKKDDHSSCNVARAALEARVLAAEQKTAALESRLADIQKKSQDSGLDFDFDPEELQKRIEKLEKLLKKPQRKKKGDAKEDTEE